MSATIGGLQSLADWLGARLFITNYRPVPLTEYVVFGSTVYGKAKGASRHDVELECEDALEKVCI